LKRRRNERNGNNLRKNKNWRDRREGTYRGLKRKEECKRRAAEVRQTKNWKKKEDLKSNEDKKRKEKEQK